VIAGRSARGERIRRASRATTASAPLLVVLAAVSTQGGAAFATTLFDEIGPLGAAWLRAAFATCILAVAALATGGGVRLGRGALRAAVALGVVMAAMNACFYESLERVPLGVAVTAEFVGPLAVAVIGSRRVLELVWILLAGAGVALLGSPGVDVSIAGLGFALGAGACWALYIVVGKRLGQQGSVLQGLAVSVAVATVLLTPFGVIDGGGRLGEPWILGAALGVGLLSTAVPYASELLALRRVRSSTFAILLSLQPAVAALVGLVALGQDLHGLEWLAVCLVIAASVGANRRATQAAPATLDAA
jgi:inner membrane transporter RhtA